MNMRITKSKDREELKCELEEPKSFIRLTSTNIVSNTSLNAPLTQIGSFGLLDQVQKTVEIKSK
jgi:hypothetical protein